VGGLLALPGFGAGGPQGSAGLADVVRQGRRGGSAAAPLAVGGDGRLRRPRVGDGLLVAAA